ncbi:MAG: hypothetical protein ACJA2Q_002547 [Pseudohongiellaceae bacterium]|jgi:hypothetical protein
MKKTSAGGCRSVIWLLKEGMNQRQLPYWSMNVSKWAKPAFSSFLKPEQPELENNISPAMPKSDYLILASLCAVQHQLHNQRINSNLVK